MSRLQDHTLDAPEVTLVRDGRTTTSKTSRSTTSPSRRKPATRKRSTSSTKRTSSKGSRRTAKPGPEKNGDRLRHITSLLLLVSGTLLSLALVSYSRLDQANADVAAGDLTGLVTNDPSIIARAAMTENWLGLVGAWIADFLINGTIGWFALGLAGLFGFWSYVVYKERDLQRAWNRTTNVLIALLLGSVFVGALRTIDWMPAIAYEMTGAVGWFLATLFGGLIGSAGTFLLVSAGLTVVFLYLFDTDLKAVGSRLERALSWLREKVAEQTANLRPRLAAMTAGKERVGARARTKRAATGSTDQEEPTGARQSGDHEPAHMIRRVREASPEVRTEEPRTAPARTTPSDVRPSSDRSDRENLTSPVDREARKESTPSRIESPVSPASPAAGVETDPVELIKKGDDTSSDEPASGDVPSSITLSRAPLEEPTSGTTPSLRVHVEEGESDEDIETEDAGELFEIPKHEVIAYDPPTVEMLTSQEAHEEVEDQELKEHARLLQEKLRTFNIEIEDLTVTPGPVVTLFEFVPAAGIKLSQIESLGDDIALALKARGIRIIAPIPGKGTVGVEIPNRQPAIVRIRSVVNTTKFREADHQLPLALGKTTVGEVFCADLAKMPHLLIAGATGAGKSVGINSILASLIFKMHPADLKLAIIDPKKIELTQYRALARHFLVSCPDIDEEIVTDPQNAVVLLKSLEMEMDRRYDMLAKSGQRNIFDYNAKIADGTLVPTPEAPHQRLPYIVLIIDELADLMITAAKEVEEPIARLAQLARAIGIHMIVATQRPSVDVLTGMIKANFPARIAYQVATKIDSRTILDMNGAEQLLGNGDMLYLPGGRPKPLRLQNAFITTDEVERLCEHIGEQRGYLNPFELPSPAERKKSGVAGGIDERDELFDEAARVIVRHQQGSVSLLQRRLKVGYARAARIVDELEDAGIVGPFDGSKARAVLLESEAELEAFL